MEANARLTASTSVVLLVLLAAEGVTILRIHALLPAHVFIGMLLVVVLGHLADTAKLTALDWALRTRRLVAGAALRRLAVLSSVAAGALLGWLLLGHMGQWIGGN